MTPDRMDAVIDYFEALPPLHLIGFCEVTYRDVFLKLRPGAPDDEIEAEFAEYIDGYAEYLRRAGWDA